MREIKYSYLDREYVCMHILAHVCGKLFDTGINKRNHEVTGSMDRLWEPECVWASHVAFETTHSTYKRKGKNGVIAKDR